MAVTVRSLSLPEEIWERLDDLALRESRSRSSMAAVLLDEALEARRQAQAVVSRPLGSDVAR